MTYEAQSSMLLPLLLHRPSAHPFVHPARIPSRSCGTGVGVTVRSGGDGLLSDLGRPVDLALAKYKRIGVRTRLFRDGSPAFACRLLQYSGRWKLELNASGQRWMVTVTIARCMGLSFFLSSFLFLFSYTLRAVLARETIRKSSYFGTSYQLS